MKTSTVIILISLIVFTLYVFDVLLYTSIGITVIVSGIIYNDHHYNKAHKAHLNTPEGARAYVKNYVEMTMKETETPTDYDDRKYAGRSRRAHALLMAEHSLDQQQR